MPPLPLDTSASPPLIITAAPIVALVPAPAETKTSPALEDAAVAAPLPTETDPLPEVSEFPLISVIEPDNPTASPLTKSNTPLEPKLDELNPDFRLRDPPFPIVPLPPIKEA